LIIHIATALVSIDEDSLAVVLSRLDPLISIHDIILSIAYSISVKIAHRKWSTVLSVRYLSTTFTFSCNKVLSRLLLSA
jgi:hypothetical protein